MTDDSVAERLRRLEDMEQIQQLFVAYKTTLDNRDFAAYSMLFAPDGEFAGVRGRPAIEAFVERIMGAERGGNFHVIANPVIEFEAPDRARARLTWVFVVRGDADEPVVARFGHYEDVLVRRDDQWLFLSRNAPMDLPGT
jgi:uncharacterized protein (TIGR02246 family)